MRIAENKDNITKAVAGLDTFTKNWCMNCKETSRQNEPVFRCSQCEFQQKDGKCLVHVFASTHKSHFKMDDFGSMS